LASASFSLAVSSHGGFSVSLAELAVVLQLALPPSFFDRLTIWFYSSLHFGPRIRFGGRTLREQVHQASLLGRPVSFRSAL
jgi:hypothetical protein